MKDLYNRNIQDIIVLLALLLLTTGLYNKAYADNGTYTDNDYVDSLILSIYGDNSQGTPAEYTDEQYIESLIQSIYYSNDNYTEDDYINSLIKSIYGDDELTKNSEFNNSVKSVSYVDYLYSNTNELRVIDKSEIRRLIKSSVMGASIIASPELLEFAKINGIPTKGRVLTGDSVKRVSLYFKRFLSGNEYPDMLVYFREGSFEIENHLAEIFDNKSALDSFISQYRYELNYPGMLIDFSPVLDQLLMNSKTST